MRTQEQDARTVFVPGARPWRECGDPRGFFRAVWRHRELLLTLVRRTVRSRYEGSFLGVGWAVLQPLLLLGVYTYVFGIVLHARWREASLGPAEFAITVFCGLVPFTLVTEPANAATGIIVAHPNYVKRVVFPLELLPVQLVGAATVVASASVAVLLAGQTLLLGPPPWTAVFLPVLAVPCILLALAAAWLLAAFGVFVRDTGSIMVFVTQVLFFVTPIVYPATTVPERFRWVLEVNPLGTVVESWRAAALGLGPIPWRSIAWVTIAAALLAGAARAVFLRSERAFADVV